MALRTPLLILASSLALSACSSLPDIIPGSSESAAESAAPQSFEGLEVGIDPASSYSRQVGRYTAYARTNCALERDRREAFTLTLNKLKADAVSDGADYLRVLGTGPLNNRGLCSNDNFQLTGIAMKREAIPQSNGASNGGSVTDSLTARLQELDALRERGLISDNEYQQLRERVLNDAY